MSKPDSLARRRFAAALLAPFLTALNLAAQQAAPAGAAAPEPVVQLEAFTVTGTNIRRLEQEKTLPVTQIDREAMEVRDAAQASDLLTAMPFITGLPGNETATLGATARGDNATISLRGIPSSNTLVLVNGRRLVPHPISQSEAGVPTLSTNVNQLPNRGLDRVDVLRDGASSIYGTDAVAGVVNYITRSDFRGTELQLRAGATGHSDGRDYRATLTHGFDFAGDKGSAVIVADFYHRDPIYARDRDFSAEADLTYRAPAPWNVSTNTNFNNRSATSEYGNFETGRVNADGSWTSARPAGISSSLVSSAGRFYLVPATSGVAFQTGTPSRTGITHDYYWNNNTYRVIQPETRRTNVFASARYELNERLTAFGDLSYYRADSLTYREPDSITQSTDGDFVIPASNPWNPFGVRFWDVNGAPNADGTPRLKGTPSAVRISNKRLVDLPQRVSDVSDTIYRGVAGLRGRLAGTWSWEAAALYSRGRVSDDESNAHRGSLFQQSLARTDATGYNPFLYNFAVQGTTLAVTGPYQNPASAYAPFTEHFLRDGTTRLASGDLRAAGEVLSLWGGNSLGAAFGGEYRSEGYDDVRPPFAGLNPPGSGLDPTDNDFIAFSPNSDTHGRRHVTALYAEAVLPVVGNALRLPLIHSLELTASARYENYSDFGNTTKPKFSANWRPVPWVMVRGSYNEGFHAPNLAQLFTGTLIRTVTGSTDSYRSPVTLLPTDGPSNRRSVAAGNPGLQPEEAEGKSAGLVVEVPLVKGLSLGVDYWEIRQRNVIASSGSIADDNQALNAATQAALAAGQAIATIDLGSGTASYQGDGSVVRLPVTQADRDFFAAFNAGRSPANQKAVVGAIDYLRTTYFNKSAEFVNGLDFDLNYVLSTKALGRFRFGATWTRLIDFHAYDAAGAPRTELLGTNSAAVGGASPRWRGTLSLQWRRKAWNAGISAYYIGDYTDSGATTSQSVAESLGNPDYIAAVFTNGSTVYRYRVSDSISYNASLSYRIDAKHRWIGDTTLRVGVINLFDAQPPLSSDSRGYDPSLYNLMARGRSWSFQLTRRL